MVADCLFLCQFFLESGLISCFSGSVSCVLFTHPHPSPLLAGYMSLSTFKSTKRFVHFVFSRCSLDPRRSEPAHSLSEPVSPMTLGRARHLFPTSPAFFLPVRLPCGRAPLPLASWKRMCWKDPLLERFYSPVTLH